MHEQVKNDYKLTLAVLGGLFALPSVISLVQRELSYGLAPAFEHFLTFYREMIGEFAAVLHMRDWFILRDLSGLQFKQILEAVPVTVVSLGLHLRADFAFYEDRSAWRSLLRRLPFTIVMGLIILVCASQLGSPVTMLLATWLGFFIALILIFVGDAILMAVMRKKLIAEGHEFHRYASTKPMQIYLLTTAVYVAGLIAFYVGNSFAK